MEKPGVLLAHAGLILSFYYNFISQRVIYTS